MRVKIDTKEMFHVICMEEEILSANMSAEMMEIIRKKQMDDTKSIILNCKSLGKIDVDALKSIKKIKEETYSAGKSFVLCSVIPELKSSIEDMYGEEIHITPTESEAWDIVQMEEIERELGLGDEESL